MLPFLKLLPCRLPLNGSPGSGHTAVLVKQVENKTKSFKDQKRQEKNYKNKYSVEWGCHNISTMCKAITTLWRRPKKKGIYDFYVKTKQLISLRISFPYELELKGTSYSSFLTDTFRTVTTPNAIFTLHLSSSLKLIFFITRKCYPRVMFKVPPLPIAICWESWGIAWS